MDLLQAKGAQEKDNMKHLFVGLCIALLMALCGTVVAQQTDVFLINYYSNANTAGAPDATVRVDNPGLTYSDVCSMFYVFTADQQMAECCGCRNTHNNLRTHSVNKNFANNPLTGRLPVRGVIKIVSASPNGASCDPSTNVNPIPDLRAWGTHIQDKVSTMGGPTQGSYWPVTETPFLDAPLGATELANLQAQCSFVWLLGSGQGVCSCGPES